MSGRVASHSQAIGHSAHGEHHRLESRLRLNESIREQSARLQICRLLQWLVAHALGPYTLSKLARRSLYPISLSSRVAPEAGVCASDRRSVFLRKFERVKLQSLTWVASVRFGRPVARQTAPSTSAAEADSYTSQRIAGLAHWSSRVGYRHIDDSIRADGTPVNDKWTYRPYRLTDMVARRHAGLKPILQRRCGSLFSRNGNLEGLIHLTCG